MPRKSKTIKIDRDTYELMRKLHLLDAGVEVEITKKEVKEKDASKD